MRKILLIVTALILWTSSAHAQYTASAERLRLIGLGMSPELAREIVSYASGTNLVIPNAVWLKWRNAANSANINALEVDATDDTVLNADSGDVIKLSVAGTSEVQVDNDLISYTGTAAVLQSAGTLQLKLAADAQRLVTFTGTSDTALSQTWGDAGVTAAQVFSLIPSTADTDDDARLIIGNPDATRGSFCTFSGNERTGAGDLACASGDADASDINFTLSTPVGTGNTAFAIRESGGNVIWSIATTTGRLSNNAAGGAGDVNLSATGTTLAVQEGTAASACSGTATANGTTAVPVATTCVTTASRIFISRTSAVAAGVTEPGCWATNIVNATSFDLDCNDAAEDSTFNWIIFHEAA